MEYMDAFNGWSMLHLLGSFIATVTLGTLNLHLGPVGVGIAAFGLGTGWEVVVDQELRINDQRGGDYYDILWDLAGCTAGTAALLLTRSPPAEPSRWKFGFSPPEASGKPDDVDLFPAARSSLPFAPPQPKLAFRIDIYEINNWPPLTALTSSQTFIGLRWRSDYLSSPKIALQRK